MARAGDPRKVHGRGSGPREEILALHRELFRRQRKLINRSVQGYTPSFRAYETRYRGRVRRYERVTDFDELLAQVRQSDMVFVGDYHTLKQAQKNFAKIATLLAKESRPLVLALEFVQGRFQAQLDAFLKGRIGEQTFLDRIDYSTHQVFDVWPNFRPLLELARKHRIPVRAIDRVSGGSSSLVSRDAFAAGQIAQAAAAPERPLVLVLIGQLHVAPPHLPAAVARALRSLKASERRSLVVYQNCEEIYWQLAKKGLEQHAEVVKIRGGEYCLVNTSPVVCQQSYLDWVEEDADGELMEASAPEHHFKEMARMVATFLRIDAREALEQVEVYTAGDMSFLTALRARGQFSPSEVETIKRQVLARESYYIPRARMAYLASLSLNHAAEEATHFIRHACAGEAMEEERGLIDGFYARILEEAMGFFGSKIVNPRRKAAHEPRLLELLQRGSKTERAVAALTIAHKQLEEGRGLPLARRIYAVRDADLFNAVTHTLGYILGDKLYYAMLQGKVKKDEIRELFFDPFEEEGSAFHLYMYLAHRFRSVRVPKRF